MNNECIKTERLILKVLDDSFTSEVLDFYSRNAKFLSNWEPARELEFYSEQYQRKQLNDELNRIQAGNLFKVWMFSKEDSQYNKIIGSIALNEIIRGCFQSCFLGYKIDETYRNKGYMTEGVSKIVEYAFRELNLHRIEANIIPSNLASIRVVEKNGFINEGVSRKYLKINGVWEDHIHMVRLNENME